MKQQLHFVTVAATDLDATRRFYDSLGWTPLLDVEGEIIFYQAAPGQLLGFFLADKFNEDLTAPGDHSRVSGVTLAHNVDSPEDVTELSDSMATAGGTVLKPPQPGQFGGVFHAHVQDPNGLIWEIAHNPGWRIGPDGTVHLGGMTPHAPDAAAWLTYRVTDTAIELLFSYGTLQQPEVQRTTFGQELDGHPDAIVGFDLDYVTITDPHVIETSGSDRHPILRPSSDAAAEVPGTVFSITPAQLAAADEYEVDDYQRISVPLRSGAAAWVYVFAG